MSTTTPLLPVKSVDYSIGGEGENLLLYIEPVDSERIHERIGTEKIVRHDGLLLVTAGRKYKTTHGTTQGGRYLQLAPNGDIVGGLNYTRIGREVILSNIYVRPDWRRQGIATGLVQQARRDFPQIKVDAHMTCEGAKLFGYAPAPVMRMTP